MSVYTSKVQWRNIMKKCKMLLIILASLVLAGCNGSKIVDERGETESVTAAENTTTDKDPDAAVEAEFYDDARGGISVECMEMVDGELKYGIVDSEMGISVTDGEVKLRVKISGEYSFEGQLLNNENTYNLYLYHNGNLHKFNYEDSDTYMYTKKVKNGEDLNMEISFKTADEITSYKIFCIVYNDKDMLGENAEHNREYNLNSQGLNIYCQDFVLDLSENTQLDNEKEGLEVCTEYNVENTQDKLADELKACNSLVYGVNAQDEFVYKANDGKYKFGAVRMSEDQDYVDNYSTFIVCDDKLVPAFDGKPILNYKGKGDIVVTKDIDLNMSKGEHMVYSVTIADKGDSYRSRYVHFNVE